MTCQTQSGDLNKWRGLARGEGTGEERQHRDDFPGLPVIVHHNHTMLSGIAENNTAHNWVKGLFLYSAVSSLLDRSNASWNKLAAAQTKMERSMLNITYKDRKTNIWVGGQEHVGLFLVDFICDRDIQRYMTEISSCI